MRLTFLGAAGMVTGSSYLLEIGQKKFLIDCGLFQGSKAIMALNRRDFLYNPAEIDAVFLTHAHIDHSGLLPKLCNSGFKGPIYATKATAELCSIMLPDSAHIQEFDAEIANRKGQRAGRKPVEPLYTVADAYACLNQFSPAAYDTKLTLSEEVTIQFRDAGHILGSSMIEVWGTENGQTAKILFSGDMGQPDQPIIKDPAIIESADYIVLESTYGGRQHEPGDPIELLAKYVNDTAAKGGNLVIPSFAVGRTQTLLYHLYKLFKAGSIPEIPIFVDSPLAIAATNVFLKNSQEYDKEAYDLMYGDQEQPLRLPQLVYTKTAEESKAINSLDKPAIIISASGMADAGRILHHLKHNLWRPESTILFVGYQSQGSLGRRILDGARKVKIMGEEISVRAEIHNMEGFSAHADQSQLTSWLKNFTTKPANIFIVHGEEDRSEPFGKMINEEFGIATYIPKYGDAAQIDGRTWNIEPSAITTVEPAVQQLRDQLEEMEKEYADFRRRLEDLVAANSANLQAVLKRVEKIRTFVKKTLSDLWS
ncbi:MBL fold metallo-hydrolase RNA specificity domain-containing protein [Sporomusa sphaeroides]|uniref:Ribonuclease n=2 Tax=Sporomusa TaxID=2375 RepID=A0ABM9W3P2_9FIRM|nr:MBL fold metallo-hydrolase [Sporomusa sphaeroides]MCM0759255.1 MBL fold metallo-hydrolase [Sporomusa sphaeroides DSM 2875]OLS58712.1 ribonuclease [Sporomusa sphaeroides DSM 2875]CVK19778.1 Ribonuclease [Sporomusa sphaeroides DSM 2875]SCM79798.1 Ribonuclease [uncultured Sporomusa sp.]